MTSTEVRYERWGRSIVPEHVERPRVLCVDDDELLLAGLKRQLHKEFDITGRTTGELALQALREDGPFAVIISDMNMPGMDGVQVLSRARHIAPDTSRILLTGYAALELALEAVNRGNIFRFLVKPCSKEDMVAALDAASEQYRLVTAERQFFEQTLRGAVNALCETLSLANPPAFARATRVRRLVVDLMGLIDVPDRWCVEVAVVLSQLGSVVLPPAVVSKLHDGAPLSPLEQELVDDLPGIADRVLSGIPRLEAVRQVIRLADTDFGDTLGGPGGPGSRIPIGARLLRLALDLDSLEASGLTRDAAVRVMQTRKGAYDPLLLEALSSLGEHGDASTATSRRSEDLQPGMVIASDVSDPAGRLLVARGTAVTAALTDHMASWRRTTGIVEPIFVRSSANGA
ncbi:MAG TPA: HD domain-containing phosphohydrolase [Acidimicrobiales bacterium]|nr:HD domain-containing phosphohydrolase [Acidimicrobiales bacterium]